MEFWSDVVSDKSWGVLQEIVKKFDLTVIGGWACYLHTKTLKSKDVDIVVDFEVLGQIRRQYNLRKNDALKKYEIKIDEIDVDIYVPYYSKLVLPAEEIQKNAEKIEGIKVPKAEALLILKQEAEKNREHSVKGLKDRVDILNLLINSNLNFGNYFKLLEKYKKTDFARRLKKIISTAKKEFGYLGVASPREIKLMKKALLEKLNLQSQLP